MMKEQTWIQHWPVRRAVPAFGRSAILRTAGVASASGLAGHTIYDAQSCVIDLMIEDGPGPQELFLVGRIAGRPGEAVASVPLYLRRGKKLLAATWSNEFGEFQLAAALQHNMSLSFPFKGLRIDVMLDDSRILRSSEPL